MPPLPLEGGKVERESVDVTNIPSDVTRWIASLEAGTAQTVVTSDGSRYSFNNDGHSHYLELVDVTRREPNGRYKRVYKGKIEAGHVTHKHVTSSLECAAEYSRWCKTPYGSKGRHVREDAGLTGADEGHHAHLADTGHEWNDARRLYIQ